MSHAAVGVRPKTDLAKTQGEQPRWLWRLVGPTQRLENLGDEKRVLHCETVQRKTFLFAGAAGSAELRRP